MKPARSLSTKNTVSAADPYPTRSASAFAQRLLGRGRRGRDWVSKTDLVSFLRCPYAFWQIDSGALARNDAVDALGQQLMEEGRDFHEMVASLASPPPEKVGFPELLTQDVTVIGLPMVENRELKLLGAPDGVITAGGALLPIEAKSHKDVRRTDELELAFYWLLLEPLRARQLNQPRGRLILRRDGLPVEVDVEIPPERFDEVRRLIREIRRVRREGVRPRVCACAACRGPLREQIRQRTRDCRDLTLISGLGRVYALALEALGIADYEDLIACDREAIVAGLRERRLFVSVGEVECWSRHAESYRDARPLVFAPPPAVGDSFMLLDLEYDSFKRNIWLIGVQLVDGDRREHLALWADTASQERRKLLELAELVAARPDQPVLTWAGHCADIPELRLAVQRHQLGDALAALFERHLDLYSYARRGLRLPIPEFALSEVASYFGVPKLSDIQGGFEAQMHYSRYLTSTDAKTKATLKSKLVAYNRDDLEGLVGVLQAITALGDTDSG